MIFLYVYLDCCPILLKSTKNAPVSPKANWPDLLPAMARDAGLEDGTATAESRLCSHQMYVQERNNFPSFLQGSSSWFRN